MKRKLFLSLFISFLALFLMIGCTAGDPDQNNVPIEENNQPNQPLEDNFNNEDRDQNLENDLDLRDNDDFNNDLDNQPNQNTNMP